MRHLDLFLVVFLACSLPAHAVVLYNAASGQTTSTGAGTGWGYVGTVNGASGVYFGDVDGSYWVLTASHVGAGAFTLSGSTYSVVANSTVRLTNTDNSDTDLILFKVSGGAALDLLPNLNFSSINTGSQVTMIGDGTNLQTTQTNWLVTGSGTNTTWTETGGVHNASGFKYDTTQTMRWGQNTVDGTTVGDAGFGSVNLLYSDFDAIPGQAQVTTGDSGGGVFSSSGALVGILLYTGNFTNQPANTAVYGDLSYFADMSYYSNRILAVVPEPSVAGLFCAGVVALLVLRRRRIVG